MVGSPSKHAPQSSASALPQQSKPSAAAAAAAPNNNDAVVFNDPEAKGYFDAAVRQRQNGDYRAAIAGFEKAVEVRDG